MRDPLSSLLLVKNQYRLHQIDRFRRRPEEAQQRVLRDLIRQAAETEWGRTYNYDSLNRYSRFAQTVPLQSYEMAQPWIDRARNGEKNILWPGSTLWFAKSSGTTNDKSKFIPVTAKGLTENHYRGGEDVLALYLDQNRNSRLFSGKTMTLGGSHRIDADHAGSHYGDLSAIMIQNLKDWATWFRTPSKEIALIPEWEKKLEAITRAVLKERVTAFAGVPSWNLNLLKHLLTQTGKQSIQEIWPEMELFIHGGVSFEPYRAQYQRLFPLPGMHYMETYNASEGFFALQDNLSEPDMLLMLDIGVFYEFIPLDQVDQQNPTVIPIWGVEPNVSYALVISTNSGLWRYQIGDTVSFSSVSPYKLHITGRTKHFINAFGEELMIDNAERALREACKATGAVISEYTAGPVFMDERSNGAHEWLIEFDTEPSSLELFTQILDKTLCSLNSDYEAKREKNITLRMPIVRSVKKGTFYAWMNQRGKLGGQNKVPRLSNHRTYLDAILAETIAD